MNVPELLKEMPETKVADSTLLSFTQELNDSLQKLSFQYQDFLDNIVHMGHIVTITDSMKNTLTSELTSRRENIFNFQSSAPAIFKRRKEELYAAVRTKAEIAIKNVAEENGYSFILDSGLKSVVYASSEFDITSMVKTKLLIK